MLHYIKFDPDCNRPKVQRAFQRGTGFTITGVALLWSNPRYLVAIIESEAKYRDLDLDLNSLSSPLIHCKAKPRQIGRIVPIEEWESKWYPLRKPASEPV